MNQCQLIDGLESQYIGKHAIDFNIGDTIKVYVTIIEGQKERVQAYTGTVIGIKGTGLNQTFTVYRNAYGSCMERIFNINSPRITKIEVLKKGDVRKSKLYYIRGKTGKKAKIKEKIGIKKKASIKEEKKPAVEEKVENLPEAEKNKEIKPEDKVKENNNKEQKKEDNKE